ncbi:MAG TPA: HAD-IIIC family phosphatase [Candidatus Paceibacterota bacterium]|jgi:FkbH-like protein|nr:HAD-IIIC family phosphatase [Candidatus Paceibacterota bacterium]
MTPLSCLELAARFESLSESDLPKSASISLVTNFTDTILQKFLIGLSLSHGIYPKLRPAPYKQYHFDLAGHGGGDITYVVFDLNPYVTSEFVSDPAHVEEVLAGLRELAERSSGPIVVATLPSHPSGAYGQLLSDDPAVRAARAFNEGLDALASRRKNVIVFDMERLFQRFGEHSGRDLRSLYAFDVPYTNDLTFALAKELLGYLFALSGMSKKCIVLDLDNTLWGGIVGEAGAGGIALGPGYPGYAYENFQDALKRCLERGILLAIASKNNPADVDEVFEKNPHMRLAKEDFGAIRINWEPKSGNITEIAKELNIGLDSMVFLDDDAASREEVKAMLPEVFVPDMPSQPEEYARHLFDHLYLFTQLRLTAEDKEKGKMYGQERARRTVIASDPAGYLDKLGVEVRISHNEPSQLSRLSQLSQKTNQFNLTTRRYSEAELEGMAESGAHIFGVDVRDKFGNYGLVLLAIAKPRSKKEVELDTFLMSCRVFSRGAEYAVINHVLEKLRAAGYATVMARSIETAKNRPSREFLPRAGFQKVGEEDATTTYRLELSTYAKKKTPELSEALSHLTVHV